MIDVEEIFRYKSPDRSKLFAAGFSFDKERYTKAYDIFDGQFSVEVTVLQNAVDFKVIEKEFGDEYVLVHTDAVGGFVGEMREECEKILKQLASECFTEITFQTEQTKRLVRYISEKFGVEPEFMWEDDPYSAVFRRKDVNKWFGIKMTVGRSKLGLEGSGNIEILNLKDRPENIDIRVDGKSFFRAYHMNKIHWYTVRLDGQVPDEELFSLVEASYNILKK